MTVRRDAVEEAIGKWGMQHALLYEEDVGTGGFGNLPAPVEHQRIGIALTLGAVFLDGADHIKAGRLAPGAVRGSGLR